MKLKIVFKGENNIMNKILRPDQPVREQIGYVIVAHFDDPERRRITTLSGNLEMLEGQLKYYEMHGIPARIEDRQGNPQS